MTIFGVFKSIDIKTSTINSSSGLEQKWKKSEIEKRMKSKASEIALASKRKTNNNATRKTCSHNASKLI